VHAAQVPRGRPFQATLSYHASSAAANHLTLRRDRANLVLVADGRVVRRTPISRVRDVAVYGGSGATRDTLTVDLSRGRFWLPRGIRFDGGASGFETLIVRGGHGVATVHDPARQALVIDGLSIRYSKLEPVVDTGPAATFTINATDGANTITFDNGVLNGDGVVRVAIDAFESISFANKTSVVINGGDGMPGGEAKRAKRV
jgi:hypothetical protein